MLRVTFIIVFEWDFVIIMNMTKKIETKNDSKEFDRFKEFTRKLVAVPKDEILRREKAEKENKKEKTKN